MDEQRLNDRINFGKAISGSYGSLCEEEYDNVDNFLSNVSLGFEEEFRRFLVTLVKQYGRQFQWSFANPKSDLFGSSWQDLVNKYQTMDDAGKIDLYTRIGMYFRKFFMDMMPYAGEKEVGAIAELFKNMMVSRLRELSIQARKV